MSFSLSGAKVLGNESSWERKFYLWNFRSRERKYAGTKVPVTFQRAHTQELLPCYLLTSALKASALNAPLVACIEPLREG